MPLVRRGLHPKIRSAAVAIAVVVFVGAALSSGSIAIAQPVVPVTPTPGPEPVQTTDPCAPTTTTTPPTATSVPSRTGLTITTPPTSTAPTSPCPPAGPAAGSSRQSSPEPQSTPSPTADQGQTPDDATGDRPPSAPATAAAPSSNFTPTENPNGTLIPGQMRSDREQVPAPFTKADADRAEILEAKLRSAARSTNPLAASLLAAGCQVFWPSPYEVCGAILDKYNSLGGPGSFLSYPTTPELTNPDGYGKRTQFLNGPIYWSPRGGAHPVVNSILNRWGVHQYEAGYLRYPLTDEIVHADGQGRHQEFEGGAIYVAFQNAIASTIGGAIRDKWNTVGAETPGSLLGYPLTDEIILPDGQGRMNRFERGVIYWSPTTGAWPVVGTADLLTGKILGKWTAAGLEAGSLGYPTGDQVPQNTGIPGDVKQSFEFGTLGSPTQPADAPDIGSDWDVYTKDDNNCPGCGDDARIAVAGTPAYLNVPQPPPTTLQPAGGPLGRSAQQSETDTPGPSLPVTDLSAQDLAALPESNPLPLCADLAPDLAADSNDLIWCAPTPQESSTLDQRLGQSLTGGTNSEWTTALQPFCNNQPQRQWSGTRSYQCMWRMDWANLTLRSNPNGTPGGSPVGFVQYVQEYQASMRRNSTTWDARAAIHIITAFGAGTGASYALLPTCTAAGAGSCTTTPRTGGIGQTPISVADRVEDFTVDPGPLAPGTKADISTYFTFRFTHPDADNYIEDQPRGIFPSIRCDNSYNGLDDSGCVVPQADPVLDLSSRGIPTQAQHILRAQQSGLPGDVNGTPLRRTTDPTVINTNRAATCNKIRERRPANTDCDEYPFASTQEGGLAPGQVLRTYSDCLPGRLPTASPVEVLNPANIAKLGLGASICYINRADNRSGGGILLQFYKNQRISNGDAFYVH